MGFLLQQDSGDSALVQVEGFGWSWELAPAIHPNLLNRLNRRYRAKSVRSINNKTKENFIMATTQSRRTAAQTAATQAAEDQFNPQAALAGLEEEDTPVTPTQTPIPNGRTGGSAADVERERIAGMLRGLREQYFAQWGEYPNDVAMQDELVKFIASREFGINLMQLGSKVHASSGVDKETAYLHILDGLGIDTTPFKIPSLTGGFRFNWRYYRQLTHQQMIEIKNKILAAYSQDLRKENR
jgi:hypothetical protein